MQALLRVHRSLLHGRLCQAEAQGLPGEERTLLLVLQMQRVLPGARHQHPLDPPGVKGRLLPVSASGIVNLRDTPDSFPFFGYGE